MLKRLAQLEFAIAALLLGIIVVLVFLAAIMRFFGYPLIWSVDMAQLLFIWLCFFGAARAMREKGHLGIDLLIRWLKPHQRLWLEYVMSLIILVFLGFLAIEGYRLTVLNSQRLFGDKSGAIGAGQAVGAGTGAKENPHQRRLSGRHRKRNLGEHGTPGQ